MGYSEYHGSSRRAVLCRRRRPSSRAPPYGTVTNLRVPYSPRDLESDSASRYYTQPGIQVLCGMKSACRGRAAGCQPDCFVSEGSSCCLTSFIMRKLIYRRATPHWRSIRRSSLLVDRVFPAKLDRAAWHVRCGIAGADPSFPKISTYPYCMLRKS